MLTAWRASEIGVAIVIGIIVLYMAGFMPGIWMGLGIAAVAIIGFFIWRDPSFTGRGILIVTFIGCIVLFIFLPIIQDMFPSVGVEFRINRRIGDTLSATKMHMDKTLLEILACPVCKGELLYDRTNQELICNFDRLAYPIINEIPIMLESRARRLGSEEE